METPIICVHCAKNSCIQSTNGQLDICEYGIAYYNDKGSILRKEALVPLRYISYNLRHELNPILSVIVEEATKIDGSITKKKIDLDKPASKILGATLMIDQFIQMITGVNEFHPDEDSYSHFGIKRSLSEFVVKYFNVHSILKSPRRADNLKLEFLPYEDMHVSFCEKIVEYLISILIDNVWKYSVSNTELKVQIIRREVGLCDVVFINYSRPLPGGLDIFSKGAKYDKTSEGFGYGLYWATVLIDHYNKLSRKEENVLQISHHEQKMFLANLSEQYFTLSNIITI